MIFNSESDNGASEHQMRNIRRTRNFMLALAAVLFLSGGISYLFLIAEIGYILFGVAGVLTFFAGIHTLLSL